MAETHGNRDNRREGIHARAKKRFDAVWAIQRDGRLECLNDREFCTIRGAQWDDEWGTQFENAPRMEVDKTSKELVRIFSDYRNNRISVDFRPDDEDGDDDTADALDGLYRADFEDCGQESQDNAFDEGTAGGMGAWRLRACYEDESDPDNDYQRIKFEPITDADQRVFFDGDAKRQDKADAKWCLVLTPMAKDAFEEQYPDKPSGDFAGSPNENSFSWSNEDVVYIGEYYEVEDKKAKKLVLTHPIIQGEKVLIDPEEEELTDLQAQGWSIDRTRTIKKPKVTKYTMSGSDVLEEEQIAGPNIPVIVYYAKRSVVGNVERCMGHVRKAKDPQRIYNGQVSWLAEIAALSPFEKPIFDPEQVDGKIAEQWAEGNIKRHPYALAKALRDADGKVVAMGPIGKVEPPSVPAALAALIQVAGQDIAELTGASDQQEEVPANTSAQAIQLVHNRSDAKTFIYLDNFAKAVRRGGEVWLGMASELYVEEDRKMLAVDDQGGRDYVPLGQPALAKDGSQITRNDFGKNKFRVLVDVGPSSQSRRDATVQSLVGMAGVVQDPQLQNVLASVALVNMDGEGLDDVQKWLRMRLIGQGVVQPTDEEKQEMQQQAAAAQQQPPSPEEQLAAAKGEELGASAMQKKADAMLKVAQAKAVGGPEAAPAVPDGLEAAHKVVQIRKDLATATNLETKTAHMPQELAIEATNAHANMTKAEKSGMRKD
jgi:hypothetical protein